VLGHDAGVDAGARRARECHRGCRHRAQLKRSGRLLKHTRLAAAATGVLRRGSGVEQQWSDGNTSIFGIVRYLPGCGLDRTFGTGGIVTTGFGTGNMAAPDGLAIQRNGRIVVVGGNGSSFVVARYLGR
jgi:hypothetical protein